MPMHLYYQITGIPTFVVCGADGNTYRQIAGLCRRRRPPQPGWLAWHGRRQAVEVLPRGTISCGQTPSVLRDRECLAVGLPVPGHTRLQRVFIRHGDVANFRLSVAPDPPANGCLAQRFSPTAILGISGV